MITAWEFAAETYLLKLQRLQNKVLRTIGNLPRRTLVHDMDVAFQIPYVYDYITKHNNIKGLNLAAVIHTTVQVSRLLQEV
jgi:hypothetical protein